MTKVQAFVLAFVLWVGPACAATQDKPPSVADSVVRLAIKGVDEMQQSYSGSCSGFVIAPERVLTAAHCKGDEITADRLPAKVLWLDAYYDLMLLVVKDLGNRPALHIRDTPAEYDENVTAYGYGFGWQKLTVMKERVMLTANTIEQGAPVGVIVQGGFIGGMSGGPVVDENGDVVMIVQRGNQQIGYGVGVQMLKVFLYEGENRTAP